MNKIEADKYDLNSEPFKSFFSQIIKDIKGFAKLNIEEQEAIDKLAPFSGKHPLEFLKSMVKNYKEEPFSFTVEAMKIAILCPLPFGRETKAEKNKRLKLENKFNIKTEPLKTFFSLVISDIEVFITNSIENGKKKDEKHPVLSFINFLNSYQKDIKITY